jgi:hypothetical protein
MVLAAGCGGSDEPSTDPSPAPSTPVTRTTAPDAKAEREAARKAPTTVKATCTADGVRLNSRTVKAQRSGVSITVSATSGNASRLRYLSAPDEGGAQAAGSVDVGGRPQTLLFPAPPGPTALSCQTASGEVVGDEATLTIYDPQEYFRDVDVEQVLGCRPENPANGPTTPARSTSKDALVRLAEQVAGDGTGTVEPGPGYVGAPGVVGLILVDDEGYGTGLAELQGNGAWVARLTATC